MIDRNEIRAQMGRLRMSVAELARRTGITPVALSKFLDGGDAKLSTVGTILRAVRGEVAVSFCPPTQRTKRRRPDADPAA